MGGGGGLKEGALFLLISGDVFCYGCIFLNIKSTDILISDQQCVVLHLPATANVPVPAVCPESQVGGECGVGFAGYCWCGLCVLSCYT